MLRNIIFALTLILIQNSAIAGSIFTSQVLINTEDLRMETAAKKEAFIEVLVRVSGQLNLVENVEIKKAFSNIDKYITQISYGTSGNNPTLILKFDGKKIRALLITAQMPFWGSPRSEVLFWIVEDSLTHRQVLWEPSASSFLEDLKAQAKRRGLPALIPKGDFEDIIGIAISDLWGGFVEPISTASARYKASAVAVVKVKENRITWQFYPNANKIKTDFPLNGEAEGTNTQMVTQLIGQIANYYVENFAVNLPRIDEKTNETKILEVSNLVSSEDFFALERTLKSLNSVGSLRLDAISDGKAIFSVSLLAPENVFHNEMKKHRAFARVGRRHNVVVMPDQPDVESFDPESGNYNSDQIQVGDLPIYTGEPVMEMGSIDLILPEKEKNKEIIELIEMDIRSEMNENAGSLLDPDMHYQWMK